MSDFVTHPLDHVVLPIGSLAVARAKLTSLGFTVAPDGVHPFGTENCCVYFSDDTFLEPLAVRDEEQVRDAIGGGNVFVARDSEYRKHRGIEGFSALVFGTDDAVGDDEIFRSKKVSAGRMLDFSRPFTDAMGHTGTASFRLAFAADPHASDIFFFTCQRINAPKVDRAALQSHANGVTRIKSVVLAASKPSNHAGIVLDASGAFDAEGILTGSLRVDLPNAAIDILNASDLQSELGLAKPVDAALRACAIVFGVTKLANTETLLQKTGIGFEVVGQRLVVSPVTGQGAAFVFEENP